MPSKAKERAERLFRQQQKPAKALADYGAKQEATRKLTAKLRAERWYAKRYMGNPNWIEKELRKVESTMARSSYALLIGCSNEPKVHRCYCAGRCCADVRTCSKPESKQG